MANDNARVTIWVNGKEVENSLKGISAEMRKTRNELRSLTIGTKEYNETASRLSALDKIYRDQTNAVKGLTREQGFMAKAAGEVKSTFADMISPATLVTGGIAALGAGLMSGINVIRETDSALRDLQAITGVTEESLNFFNNAAINLSASFGKAPAAILEAFKLAGSAKPELLESGEAMVTFTENALTLAAASRMEVSTAISSLTTIMNANGASAEDSARYINVLAAGAQKGAKEVDFLAEAFSNVGSIGKTAGLTIEEQTALLETLGEKGFNSASVAGTNLKGVILTLLEDTRNLTNGNLDLNKVYANYSSIASDASALTQIFGRENVAAAQAVLMNGERVSQLTREVTGTSSAHDQAAIQMKTLDARLDRLSTSWDRMWASWGSGRGIIGWFLDSMQMTFDRLTVLGRIINNFTGGGQDSTAGADDWKKEASARNIANAQELKASGQLNWYIQERQKLLANTSESAKEYAWIQQELIDLKSVQNAAIEEENRRRIEGNEAAQRQLDLERKISSEKKAAEAAAANQVANKQKASAAGNEAEGIGPMQAKGFDSELKAAMDLETAKTQIAIDSHASQIQYKQESDRAYNEQAIRDAAAREQSIREMSANMATTLANTTASIMSMNVDKRVRRERQSLEQQKKQGLITEEQYQKQLESIERAAFQKKKRIDIAAAMINGAVAATKASAVLGGPVNPAFWPTMGAIALQTGAQVALIAAQQFEEGGMVYGASHSNGGVPAELEGGEYVIRKKHVNPITLPILEAVNTGKIKYLNAQTAVRNTRADASGMSAPAMSNNFSGLATKEDLAMVVEGINEWQRNLKVLLPLRDYEEATDRRKRVQSISKVA